MRLRDAMLAVLLGIGTFGVPLRAQVAEDAAEPGDAAEQPADDPAPDQSEADDVDADEGSDADAAADDGNPGTDTEDDADDFDPGDVDTSDVDADADPPPAPFKLKLSGFQNLAASAVIDQPQAGAGVFSETEVEASPQYTTANGTVLAARVVINARGLASEGQSAWQLALPEASAFAIGSFGRIEAGLRAGFPQSLIGFSPSEIAFVTPGFGPESGARLDPDGGLATRFLPRALGSRIDALTYLGYAARFYDDRSAKVTYLTPRIAGAYGALSYTPRTDRPFGVSIDRSGRSAAIALDPALARGRFDDVVQAAAVYTHRGSSAEISAGTTFSYASADPDSPANRRLRRSASLSGGISAVIDDSWTLGASATYDGFSSFRADGAPGRNTRHPFGVVVSGDYVSGPWTIGSYYQHVRGNSATLAARVDTIDIVELGAAYLIDPNHDLFGDGFRTDAKLFAGAYVYRFASAGVPGDRSVERGAVLLAGARFSFY